LDVSRSAIDAAPSFLSTPISPNLGSPKPQHEEVHPLDPFAFTYYIMIFAVPGYEINFGLPYFLYQTFVSSSYTIFTVFRGSSLT
jgi:hypothetical protein